MEAALTSGEDFLRPIIRAGVQDLANLIIPGSALGMVLMEHAVFAFGKAGWSWLQQRKLFQRQQAIDALIQLSVDQARATAEAELATYALDPDSKNVLVTYLLAIPMIARRAISHPNDSGTPTTLLSQVPQSLDGVLRFFPRRPPRF